MNKSDRRARKTQSSIKQILIHLLKQKELEKITVTELCELADINRSTFYSHYCDIYELLDDIEKSCLQEMDEHIEYIANHTLEPEQVTEMILSYIYNTKELLTLFIFKMNEHTIWEEINQKIIRLFKMKTLQIYQLPKYMDEEEFNDLILFLVSGYYAIYKKWLSHNCEEDIKKIAKRTTRLSHICFEKLLIRKIT